MLVLTLGTPDLKIIVNFLPHRLTSCDGDEAQLAERGIVQSTFVMFFDGFHQVRCPFCNGWGGGCRISEEKR